MPHPEPVKRLTLPEGRLRLRLIFTIVFAVVAVIAFTRGVLAMLGREDGWATIEVSSSAGLSCGQDFVFRYYLGAGGLSATAEGKQITSLYTEACVKAYQLFQNDTYGGGLCNVYEINRRPNEELTVDALLYEAFAKCVAYNDRTIYLAPVYEMYDSLFYCSDDWETADFDPEQNDDLKVSFAELARYARDEDSVSIELLGDNRIRLKVSEEYLAYAGQENITSFIDFYWMKNAFIADYIAQCMQENGFTRGNISSYDGFVRNLDGSGESYSFNLYDREGSTVNKAAVLQYDTPLSIVYLRDYPMNSMDFQHYYELADGQIRTAYLSVEDGRCRASVPNLVSYSQTADCAQLLLELMPVFIADTFDADALPDYSVYFADRVLYSNDSGAVFTELYEDAEQGSYRIGQEFSE